MSRFISAYVDHEYLDGYTWKMTEKDGLVCVSCHPPDDKDELNNLTDFNEIEISGKFDLRISHGQEYAVELIGSEREKEKYNISRVGETLIIDYEGGRDFDWKRLKVEEIRIHITLPSLEKIEAVGVGNIRFDEFTTDELEIDLRGPVKLKGDHIVANNLSINLNGSAEADLEGNANVLDARIEFASKLRAYNLQVTDAVIETSGASTAKVTVVGTLEMEEGVSSDIDFRGNPKVVNRD
jgi:hypothetical protein